MKQKLMVVCGGQSSEHIVSRMSCTSVMNNLNKEHYDVTLVGIDQDGSWYLLDQGQADLAQDTWLENSQAIQDILSIKTTRCCFTNFTWCFWRRWNNPRFI